MEDTNSSSEEYWDVVDMDLACYHFKNGIQPFVRYYMPTIIVIGLIGNFLSALTFMATKLRKLPSSHYLTALAFADSGMLLCHIMLMSGGYPSIPGLCQLTFYSGGVFSFLSVWFVVSFTLERYIAVRYPLRRLHWCTIGRARMVICGSVTFACFFNSHLLISVHAVTNPVNETECNVRDGFIDAASIMNHIDTALTFVIPLVLIVVWNTAIAASTLCGKLGSGNKGSAASKKDATAMFRGCPEEGVAVGLLLPATAGETFLGGESRKHVRRRLADDRKITRMLLVVSLIFLLMNFPDYVLRMAIYGMFRTRTWETLSISERCWIETAQKITTILFNTNFAINFFLYSLVGANFRLHLKKLIFRLIRLILIKLDNALPSACKLRRSQVASRIILSLVAADSEQSKIASTFSDYGSTIQRLSIDYDCMSINNASGLPRNAQTHDAWLLSPLSAWNYANSRRPSAASHLSSRNGSICRNWESCDRLELNKTSDTSLVTTVKRASLASTSSPKVQ